MDTNKRILVKKYRLSIIIDIIIILLLLLLSFFSMAIFGQKVINYFPIPFVSIIFLYYFFGDKIFKNKSIGKKIMKIKVIDSTNNIPKLKQIVLRRLFEFINYDTKFLKYPYDIDVKSKTKIDFDK